MCKNITDESIVFISSTLQELQHISLSRCFRITDSAVIPLASGLRGSKYPAFSLLLLSLLSPSSSSIIFLCNKKIDFYYNICSFHIFIFFCKYINLFFSELLSLDLMLCSKVTNMSTIAIAEYCTNLTKLDISECASISGKLLPPLSLVSLHICYLHVYFR